MAQAAGDMSNILGKLESTLQVYFGDKAPQMPDNIKEVIVKFGPWITVILMILSIPVILALFGLSALLSPVAMGLGAPGFGVIMMITTVLTIVEVVLQLLALQGLFKRQMKGWKLLFYATLVGLLISLVSGNIFGFILSGVINFYILFQIKSKYS